MKSISFEHIHEIKMIFLLESSQRDKRLKDRGKKCHRRRKKTTKMKLDKVLRGQPAQKFIIEQCRLAAASCFALYQTLVWPTNIYRPKIRAEKNVGAKVLLHKKMSGGVGGGVGGAKYCYI